MPGLEELDIAGLFAPVARTSRLGLAVSGGPDSLALLLLAAEWARGDGRPDVVVYSVDHGLRREAADEVAMVLGEAARLGLRARGLRWDGSKPETGVQAAARKARYRRLAEAMRDSDPGLEALLTLLKYAKVMDFILTTLASRREIRPQTLRVIFKLAGLKVDEAYPG